MRIIGGRLRGRAVEAPRGVLSRPPLSVIRESIFNILGQSTAGGRVLDLFAGSGSLGIEAISRGAGAVHFVDSARRCAEMIERNACSLGISDSCKVVRQDALEFVRTWRGEPFDIIFMDPPFLSGKVDEALAAFDGSGLVSDRTVLVVRVHWREHPAVPPVFQIARQRKFGDSVVLFLKNSGRGAAK
jgi:16S rRNA (guanine966-N2)-methyltransferase